MFTPIKYLLKYYLYWLFFFIVLKIIFLVYYHEKSFEIPDLWGNIFLHGFKLDLSASAYIMLIPLITVLIFHFYQPLQSHRIIKIYTWSILVVISFLAVADLALYREWGYRMDATPLLYITKPKEAFASVSLLFILSHLLIAASMVAAFVYLFQITFAAKSFKGQKSLWSFISIFLFFVFLFLPIRGGFGVSVINISSAYFSDNTFANHAAINLPWNIGFSLTNFEISDNPYQFLPADDAEKLASSFTKSENSYLQIIKKGKPNILLIVLESFSANATGCLNGQIQVTPNLDLLAKEGILFSKVYASGDRTDKAMPAIFSGYPSQPTTSIIKFPNKTQNLPGLPKTLKKYGYSTYFYYGGDIDFANYKSYLMNAGFETFVSKNDFPGSENISKWGVPDEHLFTKALKDISSFKKPYFLSLFTLSSHPPFDIPMEPYLEGKSEEIKFCNSVYYTDHFLGKFIHDLEYGKHLGNTLVIIISDHGTVWPGNVDFNSAQKYHIPMIWYGDVLCTKDTVVSVISSQTDLAKTLLSQLEINSDDYLFGKNIFSVNPPMQVVYTINNGFGFVSDSLEYIYNRQPDQPIVRKGKLQKEKLMEAKAFYQLLYDDLLDR
ncbi:MAG: sulfatase-like hydrolase/transferase [Bacteroidales bacterium]|nr:sulfatase-like hydrolase/transferase [Bacteroidales bacterium]